MPLQYRYESPRKKANTHPLRSDWIDETAASSRARLEEKGWRIVERREVPESEAAAAARIADTQPTPAEWLAALNLTPEQIETLRQFGVTVPEDATPPEDIKQPEDAKPTELEIALTDVLSAEQLKSLHEAGYTTIEAIRAATDDALRDVKGVGPAAVRDIRKVLLAGG